MSHGIVLKCDPNDIKCNQENFIDFDIKVKETTIEQIEVIVSYLRYLPYNTNKEDELAPTIYKDNYEISPIKAIYNGGTLIMEDGILQEGLDEDEDDFHFCKGVHIMLQNYYREHKNLQPALDAIIEKENAKEDKNMKVGGKKSKNSQGKPTKKQSGGAKTKTDKHIMVGNAKRCVYEGPKGGKYVKQNGEFVSVTTLKKK